MVYTARNTVKRLQLNNLYAVSVLFLHAFLSVSFTSPYCRVFFPLISNRSKEVKRTERKRRMELGEFRREKRRRNHSSAASQPRFGCGRDSETERPFSGWEESNKTGLVERREPGEIMHTFRLRGRAGTMERETALGPLLHPHLVIYPPFVSSLPSSRVPRRRVALSQSCRNRNNSLSVAVGVEITWKRATLFGLLFLFLVHCEKIETYMEKRTHVRHLVRRLSTRYENETLFFSSTSAAAAAVQLGTSPRIPVSCPL